MAQIIYGSGLRLMEVLRLRVKDIDFANQQIIVRDGKGGDDRLTLLPSLIIPLRRLQPIRSKPPTKKTSSLDTAASTWQLPAPKNTPTPTANGSGNTSSPPIDCQKTRAAVPRSATIFTNPTCKKPSKTPPASPK
jgi:integrase